MMKISSFVYCDEVLQQDGKTTIVNPLQMFTPVALPSNYSFVISFGIFDYNKDIANSVDVTILDSDGDVIAEGKLDIPIMPEQMKSTKKPIGIQVNMGFKNIILNKAGEYMSIIRINDQEYGRFPINVIQGNEQG